MKKDSSELPEVRMLPHIQAEFNPSGHEHMRFLAKLLLVGRILSNTWAT